MEKTLLKEQQLISIIFCVQESSGNSQKSPESGTSLSKKTLESKETRL